RSRAKRLLAEFRSDAGRHLTEPPTLRLISGLQSGSRLFARYWSEQDVREREGGPRTFCSATGAISTYSQVSLIPSINTDLKLVALIPQPQGDDRRFEKGASDTEQLRLLPAPRRKPAIPSNKTTAS
ncbi:MAG: hypothetical protein WAK33_01705, partial [Silvibacterium sp.]